MMGILDKLKFTLIASMVIASFFVIDSLLNLVNFKGVLGTLAYWTLLSIIIVLIFSTTESSKEFKVFAYDAYEEFLMIVWPGQSDIIRMTIVVAVAVFIVSFVIWGIDHSFSWFIKQLTKKY